MAIKKYLIVVFSFCLWFSMKAQSRYKYEIEKVSNDIYVLKPDINEYRWVTSNIVVIINDKDVLVVDSGLLPSAAEEAIKEIRKLTSKPVKYLVNTHWHGDHWQGNEVFSRTFPNLKIISSVENKSAIERNGMVWVNILYPRFLNQRLKGSQETFTNEKEGKTKDLDEKQRQYLEQGIEDVKSDIEEFKSLKPVFPNTTFADKMIIKTGNRIIELHYLGPGNTIGDVIVYLPKEKILVPGDLVVYPSPFESGAFSKEWLTTSRTLQKKFSYTQLIPGHGKVLKDTSYLSYLNALFNEIVVQMEAAYRAGKPRVEEVQAVVTYETVTAALNKNEQYKQHTKNLEKGFIPAAIKNSFLSLVNGKLKGK